MTNTRTIEFSLPVTADPGEFERRISKELRKGFSSYLIEKKSLDARKKPKLLWVYRVTMIGNSPAVSSPAATALMSSLKPKRRTTRVAVVGFGPAGYFSALAFSRAGFSVTVIERGKAVEDRRDGIAEFERGGALKPDCDYSHGEGGAGAFSDGKLTSRTKGISEYRDFIIDSYIQFGAPEEIAYLAYPHVGSDNLYRVAIESRKALLAAGADIRFDTTVIGITSTNGTVSALQTNHGDIETDLVVIAPGHSSFDTIRMLLRAGVEFRLKNFALGMRAEHRQETINLSQWGSAAVPGLKAAEYRLTAPSPNGHPMYTFCMCPGGKVVPAAWRPGVNIVNGASDYARDGEFANAAVAIGIHPGELFPGADTAEEVLTRFEELEARVYHRMGGYSVPSLPIAEFIRSRGAGHHTGSNSLTRSSFPFPLIDDDFSSFYPRWMLEELATGLLRFSTQLKGYDTGLLLGLETKTSSPIQVVRSETGLCSGFSNLYVVGEGSGYSGGIISSAVDGLRSSHSVLKLGL
ncbi:MAG TPA: FAD-dependent oxidoreductase [Spirochaetia bacterium]|nr:FAD-dependent oxidoreductase [Spirochaetia bacterium]